MAIFNRRIAAGAACGLAVAGFFAFQHDWRSPPPPAKQKPAPCPAFSRTEQSCSFGAAIMWVRTGNQENLQPCIIPLPDKGGYVLWQGDGEAQPTVWSPTTPLPVVNLYGFQS